MNKFQKNLMLILGLLMCVVAASLVLELVNLRISDFLLIIAGLAFLIYDRVTGSAILRNFGIILLPVGIVNLLLKLFPLLFPYAIVLYAVALLIVLALFYVLYRNNVFAVLGLLDFLFMCGVMASAFSQNNYEMYAYLFMAISIILVVFYLVRRKKCGALPLILAAFAYLCGLVNFLGSANIINNTVYAVSTASVLLATGLTVILYATYKSKDKED